MDEIIDPEITIKILGSQWFWSYESKAINSDSFIINEDELL